MSWRSLLVSVLFALPAAAQEPMRLATYSVGLDRDGPGLLLKDILSQDDDILAIAQIIAEVAPDILLLTSFDNDFQNIAINSFAKLLEPGFPHIFAPIGNAGMASGLDISANGQIGDWGDNWGFGKFEGSKGMAVLSRYPIISARRFDLLKWQDFGPEPINSDSSSHFPSSLWPQLRLASHSLWDVEVSTPSGPLHILASHPSPPVFDGNEDANGLRNEAEISFLVRYLNGEAFTDHAGQTASLPSGPTALLADLNADPHDGDSRKESLTALLSHPRLQDPAPQSQGALAEASPNHLGPAAQDTVAWATTGALRVDYVLPGASLTVLNAGVFWPIDGAVLEAAKTSHRLVWVDVVLP